MSAQAAPTNGSSSPVAAGAAEPAVATPARVNGEKVSVEPLSAADQKLVRELIEAHERATGSRVARGVLRNDPQLSTFVAVRGPSTVHSRQSTAEKTDDRAVNE